MEDFEIIIDKFSVGVGMDLAVETFVENVLTQLDCQFHV